MKSQKTIKLLGITGFCWLLLGTLLWVLGTNPPVQLSPLFWFYAITLLALINLFLLIKVVATLLIFVSDNPVVERQVIKRRLIGWGLSKFFALGILITVLMRTTQVPRKSALLGLAVLYVVPVVIGLGSVFLPAESDSVNKGN